MHRLIHNGTEAFVFEEAQGVVGTIHTVFEGTEAECWAEIDRLSLVYPVGPGFPVRPPPPQPVPYEVSRRQFFLAVYTVFGLTREQLRAQLTSEAAKIDFDEASQFKRDYPLLLGMAQSMGYTSAQLDDLFRLAATYL